MKTGWISVDEALPNDEVELPLVMVIQKCCSICVRQTLAYYAGGQWNHHEEDEMPFQPTHWLNAPELPDELKKG
jgi:hypothetical protein